MLSEASGFSIGEVSAEVGVATATLRWWEKEDLVKPRRTASGRRVYREAEIARIRRIKRLRSTEGLNPAAIRRQLGPAEDSVPQGGPVEPPSADTLGGHLRRLRTRARKTLKEAAEDSGLSVSFISTVERGGSGASVSSLKKLAEAYRVKYGELFGADVFHGPWLVREKERTVMHLEGGARFEGLAKTERQMDPTILLVPANSGSGGFYSHAGEEFVHVVSGGLYVEVRERGTFRLDPGDTLYFPSNIPHRWWAEDEPVRAFYVNTPPSL